ncbi:MAG: cation:dicarboxylase symporter family transporter [Oscillospiraceae bacterium]|nr:cation:dicarboxylase symporter family transporter [Oscillospiraceae bacterium]
MTKKILSSPITILISMILGVFVGLYFKNIVPFLTTIDNIYLSLLTMTSLPIMICAITINIGKLFSQKFKGAIGLLLLLSLAMIILVSSLEIITCSKLKNIIKPDDTTAVTLIKISDRKNNTNITEHFDELQLYSPNNISNEEEYSLQSFLLNIVPNNIFNSIANDHIIQIVVFFIIFGVMLSLIDPNLSRPIINAFEGVYKAIYDFLNIILLFLPFSVFMTTARILEDSETVKLFSLLINLMIIIFVLLFIIIIFSYFIISRSTKQSFKEHSRAIKRTLFVAIGSGSRIATITVTMEDAPKLKIDKNIIESILPINTLLFPVGTIVQSLIIAIYASIMYDSNININNIIIMILGALFYSISISNVTSVVAASMLGIMLTPLGLPIDICIIIWIIMDMFCEEIETFCGVYANLAVISLINKKLKNKVSKQDLIN